MQDSVNNPFKTDFYTDAPVYSVFSDSGVYLRSIGKLPEIIKNIRSGYYLFSPKICMNSETIYLTDGYSGIVQEINPKDFSRGSDIYFYNIDLSLHNIENTAVILIENELGLTDTIYTGETYFLKNKPSAGGELSYLQSLQKYFTKRIVDIECNDKKLFVLIKNNEVYYLNIVNIELNNEINVIPVNLSSENLISLSLTKEKHQIILLGVFRAGRHYSLSKVILE